MAITNTTGNRSKSIGDPNSRYESLKNLWRTSRAMLNGQNQAKELDYTVNVATNILLPFSPSMSQRQYDFYKAEAELPGLVAQYAKVLTGGLLRKEPMIKLPENAPEGSMEWLVNAFSSDDTSMLTFLDSAVWEEMQTSRCWIYVDHPYIEDIEMLSLEERKALKPYPVVIKAESVINWRTGTHPISGEQILTRFLTRYYTQSYEENDYHPDYIDTVCDHYIGEDGLFYIDIYEKQSQNGENVNFINGEQQIDYSAFGAGGRAASGDSEWKLKYQYDNLQANGKRIDRIPAFPLNGSIEGIEPMLMPLIDREVALYNKVSRRNHLLLGSATYTPVVFSNMTDDDFDDIVDAGLGSWIKLDQDDKIQALETPSKALRDMETAINSTVSEMARMGIRMLSPENGSGRDSGVALEIRNAGQSAVLGSLSTKISEQMRKIIVFMLNWRYDTDYTVMDIDFNLTADLNPAPLGSDWLRLVTEWYQAGIIPRSTFVDIAKANDILPSSYDDLAGISEIQEDDLIMPMGVDATSMEDTVRNIMNSDEPSQEDAADTEAQ